MTAPFSVTFPIRFADCDAAGIVFYPRYFEMLNGLVEDFFAHALGRSFKTLHLDQKLSVPTARFEIDFKAPSRLEDLLVFELAVRRIGRASADFAVRVRCGDETRLEGVQTIVLADMTTMKSKSWPDDLRAGLERHLVTEGA